jgi:cell division septum initiation protein DivIVA
MASNGGMETLTNGTPTTERDRFANFTAATNDVVVPNKSRLQEEDIEVPYARDSTLDYDGEGARVAPGPSGLAQIRTESRTSDHHNRTTTPSREGTLTSPVNTDQTHEQYFDRMSFASTSGGRKAMGVTSPNSWEDQEKKLRTEYEMRVVTLERRLQATEGDRDEVKRQLAEATERKKDYEDEVRGLKERATTHASSLRSLQHELDLARDATVAIQTQTSQTTQQAHEEIQSWRERCEGLEDELRRLEDEKNDNSTREATRAPMDESLAAELQIEVRNLVEELNALSIRNDQLEAERDHDAKTTAALETKVEEYKRQYLAARTELRNLKATSTMFVAQPLSNDHLPASPDGNIADTHVAAFQQAIDGMLQAARSSQPSGVLPAMKSIVEAVTNIGADVKAFEERPNLDVDPSRLESLKHESTTCLSGLMNAARNHAMASGLSPVSLIDAAAGHLSLNVVELIKLLKIRRSGKAREILNDNRMSIGDMVRRGYNENGDGERGSPEQRGSPRGPTLRVVSPLNVGKHASPQTLSAMPPAGANDYRVNSFQSATSTAQRSDSFSLEQTLQRKVSSASAMSEYDAPRPGRDQPGHDIRADPYARNVATPLTRITEPANHSRGQSLASHTSASSPPQPTSYDHGYDRDRYDHQYQNSPPSKSGAGTDKEWEDLKVGGKRTHRSKTNIQPHLNTQSSSLVNAIQNLLAAIRTGGQGPALNEHLSEVIAISTSIVAVSTNALPPKLRSTGGPLISDLTANTDRLSEAQQSAAHAGGFDKQLRQGIASASFGVAKALKALMKLE